MKSLTSCLYESKIVHQRLWPKAHRVEHSMFSFYLDLDETDLVARAIPLIGIEKFALYSLFSRDHFDVSDMPLKDKVIAHVKKFYPDLKIDKVSALTNLRFLNYVFNPITVFYCFDGGGNALCAVAEVGNTFGEKKPYIVRPDANNQLKDKQKKNFYVSPFINLDADVDFKLAVPDERLSLTINTLEGEKTILAATMKGARAPLTTATLLSLTLKYPFVTFFVIAAIHFHALLLWIKKVPFIRKEADVHLQTGVMRPHPTLGEQL